MDAAKAFLGGHHLFLQALLLPLELRQEADGVGVELAALIHHLHPLLGITHSAHLHAHAEAIEQLRAQFAFFRVAGTNQDKAGGVAHADTFALNGVPAGGG